MDKNLIMREAQKFAAKGMTDKALEEWNKYLSVCSDDGVVYNTVGDLYLKKGARGDAIIAFKTAAEIFSREGFHLKAMAVYKKIIALEPNEPDILAAIAELEATRGFIASANEYLEKAIELYSGKGDIINTLRAYQRLADLNPRDGSLKVRLAEALIKAGRSSEGIEHYLEAANSYETSGNETTAEAIYSKLVEIAPHNHDVVKALAKRLLQQGKAAEAVARFKPLITPEISDVSLLSSYGEICLAAGQVDEAINTAHRALNVDAGCQPARKTLGCAYFQKGQIEDGVAQVTSLLGEYRDAQDWENLLEILQVWGANAPSDHDIHQRLHDAYMKLEMREEALRELKILGDLYYEGGQLQKSLHIYEHLYQDNPSDVTVAFRLEELKGKLGDSADTISIIHDDSSGQLMPGEEATLLANIDASPFELENFSAIAEFTPLATDSDAAGDISLDLSSNTGDGIAFNMEEFDLEVKPASTGRAPEISLAGDAEFAAPAADGAGSIPFCADGLEEISSPSSSGIPEEVLAENLDEADFYVTQGLVDDARRIYEKVLKLDPSNKRAAKALAAMNNPAEAGFDIGQEGGAFIVELDADLLSDEPPAIELMSDEPWGGGDSDVAAETGLGEAPEVAAAGTGGGPALHEAGEPAIEAIEPISPVQAKGQLPSMEDEALREAFKDFREGINRQIDEGDAETHYNLGIAYKEMGLLEEAASEFQLTVASPELAVSSYTMLGFCYREAGRFDEAITELRKGLSISWLKEEDRLALIYEMGEVYEKQGNAQEAINSFGMIVRLSPEYRDVLARLANLKNIGVNKTSAKNQRISYL